MRAPFVKLTPENCPKHTLERLPNNVFRCQCGYWQFRDQEGKIITEYKFRENDPSLKTNTLSREGKL